MNISGDVISKQGKKVVKWGPGLAVLITKEAKKVGWDANTFVRILVLDDKKEKRIVLKKMGDV